MADTVNNKPHLLFIYEPESEPEPEGVHPSLLASNVSPISS